MMAREMVKMGRMYRDEDRAEVWLTDAACRDLGRFVRDHREELGAFELTFGAFGEARSWFEPAVRRTTAPRRPRHFSLLRRDWIWLARRLEAEPGFERIGKSILLQVREAA